MKMKLLIATGDEAYAKLLSDNISRYHSDIMDVSDCSTWEGFNEAVLTTNFNVALIDATLMEHAPVKQIHLPILLWTENENINEYPEAYERINKHQRVSSIVAKILELYAKVSKNNCEAISKQTNITAVWSPAGGVGKTSVAIAYALSHAPQDSMSEKKDVFYLNLEDFSSIPAYFNQKGKGISTVFEMLESPEGNVEMLIKGIKNKEKNINFLSGPDNYDDMCILSGDNVHELVSNCAKLADELIIDLPCACDPKVRKVFEMCSRIFIVTDGSSAAEFKIMQFMSQNSIYESVKEKITIITNKDSKTVDYNLEAVIALPYVQSGNAFSICTTLSENIMKELSNHDRAV